MAEWYSIKPGKKQNYSNPLSVCKNPRVLVINAQNLQVSVRSTAIGKPIY